MREMEVYSWKIQWTSVIAFTKPPVFLQSASATHYDCHFWFPTQTHFYLQRRSSAFVNTHPRWCWGRPLLSSRGVCCRQGGGEREEGLPSPSRHCQKQPWWGVRSRRGWGGGGADLMFCAEGDKINWYFFGLTAAFHSQPSRSYEVVGVLLQLIQ